jgi:hypothetical protein
MLEVISVTCNPSKMQKSVSEACGMSRNMMQNIAKEGNRRIKILSPHKTTNEGIV